MKILKYVLAPPFIISAPASIKILHTGWTNTDKGGKIPAVWALVDTAAFNIKHTFSVIGTGREVPEHAGEYIGTLHAENDDVILHVFHDKPTVLQ